MSVDISVNITEDVVEIIATPTVNIVNVTNSASIDPGLYDLSEFTNTSVNPFTRTNSFKTVEGVSIIGAGDIDITKASVGLGNVDNTSDANKPISTATQTALNAKQDSLGFTAVPTTRTLTINGTTQDLSADRTFTVSTGITIGTTAITSGTVGRVLFQGMGNVVQQSSQLSWDNTNNALLVTTGKTFSGYNSGGSASDALKLELTGGGAVLGIQNSNASGFSGVEYLNNAGAPRVFTGFNNSNGQEFRFNNFATGGYIDFLIGGTSSFRVFNSRNIGINTTTDAGFRLDVNGTARVSDNLLLTNGIIATSTATTRLQGSTNYFTHNRLGSSGALGFQISQTGTISSFWRWSDATDAVEFGNARNAPVALFTNNTEKMRIVGNGSVLINTTTDVASSKLTIESTTQGVLFPRMTTTQKNAIATPATGLVVFDSTLNKLCVRGASAWETITSL